MIAVAELLASERRSSSSVFRLSISNVRFWLSVRMALVAISLADTLGSLVPAMRVRCSNSQVEVDQPGIRAQRLHAKGRITFKTRAPN